MKDLLQLRVPSRWHVRGFAKEGSSLARDTTKRRSYVGALNPPRTLILDLGYVVGHLRVFFGPWAACELPTKPLKFRLP